MNSKVNIIIKELGRINSRSSYYYKRYGDSVLLDKIAALISENHIENYRKISEKQYKKQRNETNKI